MRALADRPSSRTMRGAARSFRRVFSRHTVVHAAGADAEQLAASSSQRVPLPQPLPRSRQPVGALPPPPPRRPLNAKTAPAYAGNRTMSEAADERNKTFGPQKVPVRTPTPAPPTLSVEDVRRSSSSSSSSSSSRGTGGDGGSGAERGSAPLPPRAPASLRDALEYNKLVLPSYAPGQHRIQCPLCRGGSARG